MARTKQLNIRLTPAEMACLEAVRGARQSQADVVARLVLTECERRWHEWGSAGDEELAGLYAHVLWDYDHETGRGFSGRPPTPPRQIQVWHRRASGEEVELGDALTGAWRALGNDGTVSRLMSAALVQACEALLADARLPARDRRRCTQALTAYRAQHTPPQATSAGSA